MIFDAELLNMPESKNFITIPNPVLQRLADGSAKGLLIMPLGAISASVYSLENQDGIYSPKLHFNVEQ